LATLSSGDIMAEIETDKATMEFEAVDEGTIVSIDVAEGTDNVKVGTVIAQLAGEGEDASAPLPRLLLLLPRRCGGSGTCCRGARPGCCGPGQDRRPRVASPLARALRRRRAWIWRASRVRAPMAAS
jgi:pyruvate dehydrogenase E2 component (dihydrolipoamide acetyltransferase)